MDALLRACAESASHESVDGWLPLFLAIIYAAPADAVGTLLAAYPAAAATECEAFNCMPLHLAARHASARVVRAVVAAHPPAASERDADGRTPLHVAATRACGN